MSEDLLQVEVKGLLPTPGGSGVFLAAEDKAITIFIDPMVSRALTLALKEESLPRPLTHELLVSVLDGLGVSLTRVVIHDMREETFYARLHLEQENELGHSMIEVDARPSDSMVLAMKSNAPVFVSRGVWEAADDMSWALDQLEPGED